jgi:hypothetical protein
VSTSEPDLSRSAASAQSPGAQPPGQAQPSFAEPTPHRPPAGSSQPGYGTPASVAGPRPLWKAKRSGVVVFRQSTPLVFWWLWVAFAVANFIDVAVGDHGVTLLKVGVGLLAVTGIVYATTVHSRVESDDEGVTIFNPLREHRAPWGAVDGIYLGDSVEFACHRPTAKKLKTIYSWALYSSRRSRARNQIQRGFFSTRRVEISTRAPSEAADLAKTASAQLMATELGRLAVQAREQGAPNAVLTSRWSWQPLVAIVIPIVLLIVVLPLH